MNSTNVTRSPFDADTFSYFKELLLKKREEAEKELNLLENTISNLNEADDADYTSIAHHSGDVATDVEEEQVNYQLLKRTRKYIRQIDDAIQRIENGTYGICLATGKPISKERLEAVPHTRYSIEAKKQGIIEDM